MKTTSPKIDPEFRDLLPKLTDEEYRKLSIKLQLEGCLKPLIVWKETGILLDGHHSLAIYEEHKIPYRVEYMPFPTRELAIEWVIDNQLGRRNLTDERRAYYIGKKYLAQKSMWWTLGAPGGGPAQAYCRNARARVWSRRVDKNAWV